MNKIPAPFFRYLVWAILAVIFFFGCTPKYTPEKAIADVNKANDKQPQAVSELVRKIYPCITVKADTTFNIKDSLIYIDCPDLPLIVHEPGTTDTVINYVTKTNTVRVPVHIQLPAQTITKYIEDSAKIKSLSIEMAKRDKLIEHQKTMLENMTAKRDGWRKWFWWLLLAFIISTGLHFVKLKIPFIH